VLREQPDPESTRRCEYKRERVLFIGTQFSILYTSMYSPAKAATPDLLAAPGFSQPSPPECPVELEIVTSLLMDSHTLLLIVVVVVVVMITIKSPRQSAYMEISLSQL